MVGLVIAIVCTFLLASILAASFLFPAIRTNKSVAANTTVKVLKTFTPIEVSKHSAPNDCWIIIKNKVYDVTPYVEEHPGGYAILNHAGEDSTEGFYGPQHASRVFDMVEEFYIGDLI